MSCMRVFLKELSLLLQEKQRHSHAPIKYTYRLIQNIRQSFKHKPFSSPFGLLAIIKPNTTIQCMYVHYVTRYCNPIVRRKQCCTSTLHLKSSVRHTSTRLMRGGIRRFPGGRFPGRGFPGRLIPPSVFPPVTIPARVIPACANSRPTISRPVGKNSI